MTTSTDARARVPHDRAVLREQFRSIGEELRIAMIVAVVLAACATVVIALQVVSGGIDRNFQSQPSSFPGVMGALLAIALWARQQHFGTGFLWTLPVDRTRHALLRVVAGWMWLMCGVVLYALAMLVIALIAGTGVFPVATLQLVTAPLVRGEIIDPSMLRTVEYAPGAIIWIIPFASSTAMYLLASAFMLGVKRPLLWIAAVVVSIPAASLLSHSLERISGARWLADAPQRAITALIEGRYGAEQLLTLRTWSFDARARLASGEGIQVWTALPDLSDWRIASLLWIGAGLLALLAAASRHRERRRR